LFSNLWAKKVDKEKSLSGDDEPVQTSKRSGHPPKFRVKAKKKTSKTTQKGHHPNSEKKNYRGHIT